MSHKVMHVIKDANILLSKFRGSMIGALVGDCIGAPYEGEILEDGDKLTLRKCLDTLEGPFFKAPVRNYTDDTVMTKAVSNCLIEFGEINSKALAGSFMRDFFNEPKRGYGQGVISIFTKLRQTKLEDPLQPAKEQFGGNGSYGNGAAMRSSPVGLFCFNKPDKIIQLTKKSAEITHTNRLGVNGAILQALAVQFCVNSHASSFDQNEFLNDILTKMKNVEEIDDEGLGLKQGTEYQIQLMEIQRLLKKEEPTTEEILNKLGHNVAAQYSVPTALYCFLRGQLKIKGIQSENPFRRTLEFAISLGGDTDTIASMAASLSGALYGDSVIAENLIKHCEGHTEIMELAENLYHKAAK